jgi:glutaconate CoA-transferase subunit A
MSELRGKIVTMDTALDAVCDGMSVTAGGFAHSHQPMALARALIRRGTRRLTMMSVAECWVAEFLAAAGVLERAYFSNFMFEGFGRCRRFSEGVEAGHIEVEDHSHYGMVCRLQASALGLPFVPMRAMAGTDILAVAGFEDRDDKSRFIASPFGNGSVTAVSPLKPDVAIIHAARADAHGNIQLFGPTSVVEEQARAASHVVVSVEEIVETGVIRRSPELTILPGLLVDAVVHVPYGAHPTGVFGYYQHDMAHLTDYYEASRTEAGTEAYLGRWVHGMHAHETYLDALGVERLMKLRVDPALGYIPAERKHV